MSKENAGEGGRERCINEKHNFINICNPQNTIHSEDHNYLILIFSSSSVFPSGFVIIFNIST